MMAGRTSAVASSGDGAAVAAPASGVPGPQYTLLPPAVADRVFREALQRQAETAAGVPSTGAGGGGGGASPLPQPRTSVPLPSYFG